MRIVQQPLPAAESTQSAMFSESANSIATVHSGPFQATNLYEVCSETSASSAYQDRALLPSSPRPYCNEPGTTIEEPVRQLPYLRYGRHKRRVRTTTSTADQDRERIPSKGLNLNLFSRNLNAALKIRPGHLGRFKQYKGSAGVHTLGDRPKMGRLFFQHR
jgi:hypothetical protein